jgi:hypothetical protein
VDCTTRLASVCQTAGNGTGVCDATQPSKCHGEDDEGERRDHGFGPDLSERIQEFESICYMILPNIMCRSAPTHHLRTLKACGLKVLVKARLRRHLSPDRVYAIVLLAAKEFPEIAGPITGAKADAARRKRAGRGADGSGGRGKKT